MEVSPFSFLTAPDDHADVSWSGDPRRLLHQLMAESARENCKTAGEDLIRWTAAGKLIQNSPQNARTVLLGFVFAKAFCRILKSGARCSSAAPPPNSRWRRGCHMTWIRRRRLRRRTASRASPARFASFVFRLEPSRISKPPPKRSAPPPKSVEPSPSTPREPSSSAAPSPESPKPAKC